jgi:hypothetical protein
MDKHTRAPRRKSTKPKPPSEAKLTQSWLPLLVLKVAKGLNLKESTAELRKETGLKLPYTYIVSISRTPQFQDSVAILRNENMGRSVAQFLHKLGTSGVDALDHLDELARCGTPDDSVRRGASKDLAELFAKIAGLGAGKPSLDSTPANADPKLPHLEQEEELRLREALAEARGLTNTTDAEFTPVQPSSGGEAGNAPAHQSLPGRGKRKAKVTSMKELKEQLAQTASPFYVEPQGA